MYKGTKKIQTVSFNLNSFSDLHLKTDFLFFLPEIGKFTKYLSCSGSTSRSRYVCEPNIATVIFLYRIATSSRWYNTELKFGLQSSKLSEIFWELVELLNEKVKACLERRKELLREREMRTILCWNSER